MPEQQKTKNSFDNYYKDYEKTLKDIAQEEENLRRKLNKEEERIRLAIKESFNRIKETFSKSFEPSLFENQNGEITIKMQHSFSLKFLFEVEEQNNKFKIKLSTRGEVENYKYNQFVLPQQSTVTDYIQFIENKFDSFLEQFNKYISSIERDKMLNRLRQEVKKPS